jgi:hypothetical protein
MYFGSEKSTDLKTINFPREIFIEEGFPSPSSHIEEGFPDC